MLKTAVLILASTATGSVRFEEQPSVRSFTEDDPVSVAKSADAPRELTSILRVGRGAEAEPRQRAGDHCERAWASLSAARRSVASALFSENSPSERSWRFHRAVAAVQAAQAGGLRWVSSAARGVLERQLFHKPTLADKPWPESAVTLDALLDHLQGELAQRCPRPWYRWWG